MSDDLKLNELLDLLRDIEPGEPEARLTINSEPLTPAGFRAREAAGMSNDGYRLATFKNKSGKMQERVVRDYSAPLSAPPHLTGTDIERAVRVLTQALDVAGPGAITSDVMRSSVLKVAVALHAEAMGRIMSEQKAARQLEVAEETRSVIRPRRKVK